MKVEVINYQSIDSAGLEIKGFTVLTGPTNTGKSALVRAISSALFNAGGKHVIGFGSTKASVVIEQESGVIGWERSQDKVSLRIDGQYYDRVAKAYESYTKAYGFWQIEEAGSPQVAHQHDAPFLLGMPPSQVAKALHVIGRIDVISEALKTLKLDLNDVKQKRKVRDGDVAEIKRQVASYDPCESLNKRLELLHKQLERVCDVVHHNSQRVEELKKLRSLGHLPEVRPVPPVVDISSRCALLSCLRSYSRVANIPLVKPVPEVKNMGKSIESLVLLCRFRGVVNKLKDVHSQTAVVDAKQSQLTLRKKELETLLGTCPLCGQGFGGSHGQHTEKSLDNTSDGTVEHS